MINIADAPIGVFDSGVGGLTVAREIMRQIPNERIVYFAVTESFVSRAITRRLQKSRL